MKKVTLALCLCALALGWVLSGCDSLGGSPSAGQTIDQIIEQARKDGGAELKTALERLQPKVGELLRSAMDSQLASSARQKIIDMAYGAVKTDADKTQLLDICLEMAGDPNADESLRVEAAKICGKLAVKSAKAGGEKKLLEIAKDPACSPTLKKAALDALERLDTSGKFKSDIQKLR